MKSRLGGETAPGGIQPHDAPPFVDDQQPAPHVHGGGGDHFPPLDKGKLGRAAADVDVEYALSRVMGYAGGPRAEGREHRFHVVAGGRADEVPALLRENARDGLGVFAPQGFAGQDHYPGVDVVRVQPGIGKGPVDNGSQLGIVDQLLAPIRSEGDRGLEQRLAGNDEVTARELLSHAPQVDAGKNDLRPRGADIDPDASQGDMVLDPQGVVLETAVRLVVIVVVVSLVSVVAVIVIAAVKVVLQRVRALRVGVVRHGNWVVTPKKRGRLAQTPWNLARPAGIEPTTPWFVARYSIQLSYGRERGADYSRR